MSLKHVGCVPPACGRQANAPFKGLIGDQALHNFKKQNAFVLVKYKIQGF